MNDTEIVDELLRRLANGLLIATEEHRSEVTCWIKAERYRQVPDYEKWAHDTWQRRKLADSYLNKDVEHLATQAYLGDLQVREDAAEKKIRKICKEEIRRAYLEIKGGKC
jgi:hypothetical protein